MPGPLPSCNGRVILALNIGYMHTIKAFSLVAITLWLTSFTCNKADDYDKRHVFTGSYQQATGPARFVFDAFGQYKEEFGRDTASFTIEKISKTDSADYIYILGAHYKDTRAFGADYHDIALKNGGFKIAAIYVSDTSFTIPYQLPFDSQGNGLSIDGKGVIKNGKLELTYHTFYRGFNKYATVSR
jgi:hypothetical protein